MHKKTMERKTKEIRVKMPTGDDNLSSCKHTKDANIFLMVKTGWTRFLLLLCLCEEFSHMWQKGFSFILSGRIFSRPYHSLSNVLCCYEITRSTSLCCKRAYIIPNQIVRLHQQHYVISGTSDSRADQRLMDLANAFATEIRRSYFFYCIFFLLFSSIYYLICFFTLASTEFPILRHGVLLFSLHKKGEEKCLAICSRSRQHQMSDYLQPRNALTRDGHRLRNLDGGLYYFTLAVSAQDALF